MPAVVNSRQDRTFARSHFRRSCKLGGEGTGRTVTVRVGQRACLFAGCAVGIAATACWAVALGKRPREFAGDLTISRVADGWGRSV
jgi:hypothetical protein